MASAGLPSKQIGSWTNRLSLFLKEYPDFFDLILSPTGTPDQQFVFCKKRKPVPAFFLKLLRQSASLSAASQYLDRLDRVAKSESHLQLVVIDDLVLLEAAAYWKWVNRKNKEVRIDFSFHGHDFILPESWGNQVDQVLFLTQLGYLETRSKNAVFTPQVQFVGNGTDSRLFFPLDREAKLKKRLELGYSKEDRILLWVSNPRPKKGLKLFVNLGKKLRIKYPELKILIIGNSGDFICPDQNWKAMGKLPNHELAKYFQIGDFYCFTSLWNEGFGLSLIEAAKCGNQVIASQIGGIPEVVNGLPGSYLVPLPNQVVSWEAAFDQAWSEKDSFKADSDYLYSFHDVKEWLSRFLIALNS